MGLAGGRASRRRCGRRRRPGSRWPGPWPRRAWRGRRLQPSRASADGGARPRRRATAGRGDFMCRGFACKSGSKPLDFTMPDDTATAAAADSAGAAPPPRPRLGLGPQRPLPDHRQPARPAARRPSCPRSPSSAAATPASPPPSTRWRSRSAWPLPRARPGRTQHINLFALGPEGRARRAVRRPAGLWLRRRGARRQAALAGGDGRLPGAAPQPARRGADGRLAPGLHRPRPAAAGA